MQGNQILVKKKDAGNALKTFHFFFCRQYVGYMGALRAGCCHGVERGTETEFTSAILFREVLCLKLAWDNVIFSAGIRVGRKISHLMTTFHFCSTD